MNTGMKIGAAVAGGYILGRRRKAKLALAFGGWLIGKKLNWDPKALAAQAGKELQSSPQFGQLRDQLRDEVLTVGKSTAGNLLTAQTNRLADALHRRTESLQTADEGGHASGEQGEGEESPTGDGVESTEGSTVEEAPAESPRADETASEEPKRARPRRPASPRKPMSDAPASGRQASGGDGKSTEQSGRGSKTARARRSNRD